MSIDFSKITGLSDRYGKVVQISDKYGGVLWRKPEHVHSFLSDWVIDLVASCTVAGEKHRVCSTCGHVEKETIPALGHSYTSTVTPATCEEGGYTTHTCKCGHSYTDSETEPNGHSWGTPYYDSGFSTGYGYACTVCGKLQSLTPPAHVHSYTYSKTVAATCETGGYEVWVCTCGATEHRNETEALDHSYNSIVTAPTCEEGGYTTHTCTRCGHSYTDSATEPNGHFWGVNGGWVTDVEATCEKGGTEKHTCVNCGKVETRNTDPLDHDWSDTTVEYGNGFAYECKRCGAYDPIEPEGCDHASAEVVDVIAPTCTEGGYTQYRCSLCGWEWEDDETEARGHNYKSVVTAPTCTAKGYTTHTCSRCNDSYTDSYTDIISHSWSGWTTTLKPTCDEDGSQYRTCSGCGKTETDPIEALSHKNTTYHSGKAATCTEDGYTGYNECDDCGKIIDGKNVIKATGHTEETVKGYAATCTTAGKTDGKKCTVCGKVTVEQKTISALGHSYSSKVTPATCTEGGYTTHTCTVCGHSYTDSETEPNGHNFVSGWQTVTEPTCTHRGSARRTCLTCGYTETREIAALGHEWGPPEYDDGSSSGQSVTCERCGATEEYY